ncbi:MAG: MerR family transcriptional regulator [Acidimicrobiales bacterium]|nr:MerR family transcriptional regulator [Acidimicrobiales bacterium]
MTDPLFGIEELVARADARVAASGIEAPNGQVAEALTVRNVRYYATLGLLAPPAARRGRNALYDDTHVDQLVAVKRLQGDGLQLAEIQRALVGLAPEEVARVAAGGSGSTERFWAARATTSHAPTDESVAAEEAAPLAAARAVAPPAGFLAPSSTPALAPDTTRGTASVTPAPYPTATVFPLGEGVALQVPTGLALSSAAATRVLDAARAVLLPTAAPDNPDAPLHPLIAPKTGPHNQESRR